MVQNFLNSFSCNKKYSQNEILFTERKDNKKFDCL